MKTSTFFFETPQIYFYFKLFKTMIILYPNDSAHVMKNVNIRKIIIRKT